MGGNNDNQRQTKNKATSFSLFGFLKNKRQQYVRRDNNAWEDVPSPRKVWPSDYDRGSYVAEPGIDRKASAFIARFHESRFSESERHAIGAAHRATMYGD